MYMYANPYQAAWPYGFGYKPAYAWHPPTAPFGQMHMAHHPYPYQQAPSQDQYPEAPSQLGKQTTSKAQPTTKAQPKHTHYQTDWQHGYPYGQGSGMFPDYYNNTY